MHFYSHLNFGVRDSQNIVCNSKQHQQQQEGKTSATLPLVVRFFLRFSAASANFFPSLPLHLSIYLVPSLSRSFISLHRRDGCVRMHACKRRRQHASYVPRKRNPYTRAHCVFLSFSLIPLTQSTCPYAAAISLQCARESRKGKSRCERVRPILHVRIGRGVFARTRKN